MNEVPLQRNEPVPSFRLTDSFRPGLRDFTQRTTKGLLEQPGGDLGHARGPHASVCVSLCLSDEQEVKSMPGEPRERPARMAEITTSRSIHRPYRMRFHRDLVFVLRIW